MAIYFKVVPLSLYLSAFLNSEINSKNSEKNKINEITERLEQGIKNLFNSERYKEYLQVMSKFHNYSFNNTLLIAMQKPDASYIAGFNAWKNKFGRNVMKGEKGIRILAPSPYKIKKEIDKIDPTTQKPVTDKNGKPVKEETEITIPAFKIVSVFDVSQTEGKELPSIGVDELTGDVEQYNNFFKAAELAAPVPVGVEKIESGAKGYYSQTDKRIAINEGMSELQNIKTLIHETAHAKLHDIDLNASPEKQADRPDRRTCEVQAESIAYAVCQHYGLDTSDYSFSYVAQWSSGRELAELKASLETIRSTASELIMDIDKNFTELTKDKEQAQEKQPEGTAKIEIVHEPYDTQESRDFSLPKTFCKMRQNPYSDSPENSCILQEYVAQDNGMAKMGDILYMGTPEQCQEFLGKLETGELSQEQVKEIFTAKKEAACRLDNGQSENIPDVTDKHCKDKGSWAAMIENRKNAASEKGSGSNAMAQEQRTDIHKGDFRK